MAMIKKDGTLRTRLIQAFSALSYQHSGEMLSISRKEQLLSGGLSDTSSENLTDDLENSLLSDHILLAFDNDIEDGLIKYSIGAAKYFNAKIDILTSLSKEEINRIMNKQLSGQAVPWSYIKLDTGLLAGIAKYTSSHTDVVFMVTSQHQALIKHYIKTKHAA